MKTITRILTIAFIATLSMSVNANELTGTDVNTEFNVDEFMEKTTTLFTIEEELEVENWMVQPNSWKSSNKVEDEKTDKEENLQVENWMTDLESYSDVENDNNLQLQAWMFNF